MASERELQEGIREGSGAMRIADGGRAVAVTMAAAPSPSPRRAMPVRGQTGPGGAPPTAPPFPGIAAVTAQAADRSAAAGPGRAVRVRA